MKNIGSASLLLPEIKIVEASAGSGKTYALAKRYLYLLINPKISSDSNALRNILAITFTNKAAREMKERILDFLKKIALDAFGSIDEKKAMLEYLGVSDAAAVARAKEILDDIIHNFNYFQVQTIDSFINIILSGCALELKLSANFRIKDTYFEYLKYSFDECIERVSNEKEVQKIFDKFLRQYIYVENKNSWFVKKDILDIIGYLFSEVNVYGKFFEKIDITPAEIINKKKETIKQIALFSKKIPACVLHKKFTDSIDNFLSLDTENFDLGKLGKYFEKDELPILRGKDLTPDIIQMWLAIRENFVKIAELEAMSLFNCYIDIFELVYAEFKEYSRKDDVLFLEELNRQTKILFNAPNFSVPELYYRLASRIKHYLIDEFQDTSQLQWDNLFLMIEEALSKQGSLFYVGDKKQAIYRFRGGQVNLFDDLKKKFSKLPLAIENLNKNRRSREEIVLFNNHIFCADNLKRFIESQQPKDPESPKYFSAEDIEEITGIFKDCAQGYILEKEKGYVRAEIIECKDSEERDDLIKEKLVTLISELKKRIPLKDIAVLCRSNKEIEQITGWLIEEEIDVESERTLNIKNNPLVKELIAFLNFLSSPVDNLNFAAFLLGSIFSKASGIAVQDIRGFLFKLRELSKNNNSFYLYREFQRQYPDIWDKYVSEFHKNTGLIPLYELLVSIIEKFEVFKNFPDYHGFFMRFLELIKEEEKEHAGILDFLSYLEDIPESKLYVKSSCENAIKLLTIHKAKGLEFSVVILPFLEMDLMDIGSKAKKTKTPYVVYESDDASRIGLLRLDSKYTRFSSRLKNIYRKEYLKSFIDELNTLYVSFSRPKDELYLFIPCGIPRTDNAARGLIPDDFWERGQRLESASSKAQKTPRILNIPSPSYRQWIGFLKEEFVDKEKIRNKAVIEQGNFAHLVLSNMGTIKSKDLNKTVSLAVDIARNKMPYFKDYEKCAKMIESMLKSEAGEKCFLVDENAAEIYREKELVNKYGHTKRIDRIIVKKDKVMVIDFKSASIFKNEFKEQINEYMSLAAQLYPGKNIEGYVVLLESQKAEKINA